MNAIETKYFNALTEDRDESAKMLEKPSMRGVKTSVVEKYSDQAHFIYELLQNADDALARHARFVLESDHLMFAHDGARHFSVSDPAMEEEDSANGRLGDINAITSIANSNKTKASVGKFGVGFKAVFQYTTTPYIYDPNVSFKIERFIVPKLLKDNLKERKNDETAFVFPFDHKDRTKEEAFRDIEEKLKGLTHPLLFLSHLETIRFRVKGIEGAYEKEILEEYKQNDILTQLVCLRQSDGVITRQEKLWLFSRTDNAGHTYCVGFFVDSEGHLRAVHESAFCFFPTKEATNLNFIVHAPFLLTDSREGIRAGVAHNEDMIDKLSALAADSLVLLRDLGMNRGMRLIDDHILDIIPTNPHVFSDPASKRKVSFRPVYTAILEKFKKDALIPTENGYTFSRDAYWASTIALTKLFPDRQLEMLCDNPKAKWAFPSINRDAARNSSTALASYVDSITRTYINEDEILSEGTGYRRGSESIPGITPEFIESQPIDWLHIFYRWVSDNRRRITLSRKKPIFLDENGKATAVCNSQDEVVLYFPAAGTSGYTFVNRELLKDPYTKRFLMDLGVKEPSIKDQINQFILPAFQKGEVEDPYPYFKKLFNYYSECRTADAADFLSRAKKIPILMCEVGGRNVYSVPGETYLPLSAIQAYYSWNSRIKYVRYQDYLNAVGEKKEEELLSFLKALGVVDHIQLVPHTLDAVEKEEGLANKLLPVPEKSTRPISYWEMTIEGCRELLQYIETTQSDEPSVALWNALVLLEAECGESAGGLANRLVGSCEYFYYRPQRIPFVSTIVKNLKERRWLKNQQGEYVSPQEISVDTLSDMYDVTQAYSDRLLEFLDIKEHLEESLTDTERKGKKNESGELEALTEEDYQNLEMGKMLSENGIGKEEVENFVKEYVRQKEERRMKENSQLSTGKIDEIFEQMELDFRDGKEEADNSRLQTSARVVKDILGKSGIFYPQDLGDGPDVKTDPEWEEDLGDEDEYIPQESDYHKIIEEEKVKSASDLEDIVHLESLRDAADTSKRYSYGWFKALLEMECENSRTGGSSERKVSIAFGKVEREPDTQRTLMLRFPSQYIPAYLEDMTDIPLVLHTGSKKKNLIIEVASVKSYTLRVKLKPGTDLSEINFDKVTSATIDTKSPAFLMEELKNQFYELGFSSGFDMQKNLPGNIRFVFGPPGTGKTTHLSWNILAPLLKGETACRILVLTPTNKAADVLTRKMMDAMADAPDGYSSVIRFGATADEEIERAGVFQDKTVDLKGHDRCIVITTIARFPYDYFISGTERMFLREMNWDYIVVDEASMIPIANIVYPLYKKKPKEFIISGDPFQIEPIASVNLWKDENIYTMVELNSFTAPTTVPHPYKVELLTTQYRSVPAIGEVFSRFAYGGILEHYRSSESRRELNLEAGWNIRSLNVIKYPVSKYESVYKAKRLLRSNYQVYSALFTYEFVVYLSKMLADRNPDQSFTIGVISPYRAQADLLDKLLASETLPDQVDVQVGTIHSFQGDECDIVFAIFNTPPTITASKNMFLNKMNILNVSISRAKDYLFVVMPDGDTEKIENLVHVNRVEQLMKESGDCAVYMTHDLEKKMFGDPLYLEKNAFSTTHQSVNVYRLPERCYEIRAEENAVDVQIHKAAVPLNEGLGVPEIDRETAAVEDAVSLDVVPDNAIGQKDVPGNVTDQNSVSQNTTGLNDVSESVSGKEEVTEEPLTGETVTEGTVTEELSFERTEDRHAKSIDISGKYRGEFALHVYKEELDKKTKQACQSMILEFLMQGGKQESAPVYVNRDHRVIYITEADYRLHEACILEEKAVLKKKPGLFGRLFS